MDSEPLVRDETVTLDGLRFHYRDWGDPAAPPVVLLHAYLQHPRSKLAGSSRAEQPWTPPWLSTQGGTDQ